MRRWEGDGTALPRRPVFIFVEMGTIKKQFAWSGKKELMETKRKEMRWLRDGPVVRYRTETFCPIDGGKRPCGSRREGAGELSGCVLLLYVVLFGGKKMRVLLFLNNTKTRRHDHSVNPKFYWRVKRLSAAERKGFWLQNFDVFSVY